IEKNDTLGGDGTIKVSVETTAGDDYASEFSVEAEVSSASGQWIANRASKVLHPASFYVGLQKPAFFVDVKNPVATTVVAADLQGATRAGVPVTVSLLREQWVSERRPENPGFNVWVRKEIAAGEWRVTTASQPAPLSLTIKD